MKVQVNTGNISKCVNEKFTDRDTYTVSITFGGDFSLDKKKTNNLNAKRNAEYLKRLIENL